MKETGHGKTYKFGDVVLAEVHFTDMDESKKRPALVLFEQYGNVVVAGITSNINMKGIRLTKEDGVVVDSTIKINYLFTISKEDVVKKLFSIHEEKKKNVCYELLKSTGCEKYKSHY